MEHDLMVLYMILVRNSYVGIERNRVDKKIIEH